MPDPGSMTAYLAIELMSEYSLTNKQKQQVLDKTRYFVERANRQLNLDLADISVRFDLKGKSSGMFVVKQDQYYIRYNEMIFSAYYEDSLINTVAHEVAHYVVFSVWGLKKVKPHGKEWKQVMAVFEVEPEVTSDYDITHIPLNQQRRFEYACSCMTHLLTTTRHNKVQTRKAVYSCRQCRQPLRLVNG